MAIPVALETPLGIVMPLPTEELAEPWMASLDLPPGRPTVIGQIVTTAALNRAIDESSKVDGALFQSSRVMNRVQVEDHTGIALACLHIRPAERRAGETRLTSA